MATPQHQEWEESDYIAALARLEALTNKITSLRTTIPSLISPLTTTTQSSTKKSVFMALKKSAVQAVAEVKETRESWESDEMKGILERARGSRERDGDLSLGKRVEVWGWCEEMRKVEGKREGRKEG